MISKLAGADWRYRVQAEPTLYTKLVPILMSEMEFYATCDFSE